jgi:HK97 gp10 family phage protein
MSGGMVTWWVYVRRSLWYWKFVEFGTEKMAARPFIRPAFEAMKMDALERMRQYAAARIEKEAGKR